MKAATTLSVCLTLLLAQRAFAEEDALTGIYVEYFNIIENRWVNVPGFPNRNATPTPQSGRPSGSPISFSADGSRNYRIFAVEYSSATIGNISVSTDNASYTPTLIIGRWSSIGFTAPVSGFSLDTPAATTIGTVSMSGKWKVQAYTGSGYPSNFGGYNIVRLDADSGAIGGAVTHNPSSENPFPSLAVIHVPEVESDATIQATVGAIGQMEISSAMNGKIVALAGPVGRVLGANMTVGSTGQIIGVGVDANGLNVGEITCLNFNGTVNAGGTSPILPAAIGAFDVGNDVGGTAYVSGFNVFKVERDLSGTINFSPSFPEDKRLTIGRSFTSTGVINVPAEAMLGQVFINKNNAASPNVGTWAGAFNVGGVPLANAPYYTNTFADIGGGAVGLATFHLHEESCLPPHNSVVALHVGPTCLLEGDPTCLDLLTCVTVPEATGLEFYGPLADLASNNAPIDAAQALVVKVRALVSNPTPWGSVPDTASNYKIQLEGTGTDADRRTLVLTRDDDGPLGVDAEFQVSLKSGQTALKSFGVTSTPTVGTFTYQFAIVFDCRGGLLEVFDMNEDGILNYADIYAWLLENEDFDGDGPDPEDLATLINAILAYQAGT